jgi:hypothetical protein
LSALTCFFVDFSFDLLTGTLLLDFLVTVFALPVLSTTAGESFLSGYSLAACLVMRLAGERDSV